MGRRNVDESRDLGFFLGNEASCEGKIGFTGMGRVNGMFNGEIAAGGELIIDRRGVVKADIKVDTLIIRGEVHGYVSAKRKTVVSATGKLFGNIDTPVFVIEEGGTFEGMCKMGTGQMSAPANVTEIRPPDLLRRAGK